MLFINDKEMQDRDEYHVRHYVELQVRQYQQQK